MNNESRGFDAALRTIDAGIVVLADLALVCAQAYCTTKWRDQPIIDRHFTPGNGARYEWEPLKASTLAEKSGQLGIINAALRAKGLRTVKGDKTQGERTTPMLVRTGAMRNFVRTEASIFQDGPGKVRVVYDAPDYMHWHVDGGTKPGRPPKRDWTAANATDIEDIQRIAQQFADQSIGAGRANPIAPG